MKFIFPFIAIVGLAFLFSACTKEDQKPWDLYVPEEGPGGEGTVEVEFHPYRLHAAPLPAGRISGKMVLIPIFDSTFNLAGDTNLYHSASGFIDLTGDTAFVTDSFWMDTTEVTKAEWLAIMGDSTDKTPATWPRTDISWFNAIRYCVRKSVADGLTPCYDTVGWRPDSLNYIPPRLIDTADGYRLPTEDQWEYAARGGARNLTYATDDGTLTRGKANYIDSALFDATDIRVVRTAGPYTIIYTWDSLYVDSAGTAGDTVFSAVSERKQTVDSVYYIRDWSYRKIVATKIIDSISQRTPPDTFSHINYDTTVFPAASLSFDYSITHKVKKDSSLEVYRVRIKDTSSYYDTLADVTDEIWWRIFDYTSRYFVFSPAQLIPGEDTVFSDTLVRKWRLRREFSNYAAKTFYDTGCVTGICEGKNVWTYFPPDEVDSLNMRPSFPKTFGYPDSLVVVTNKIVNPLLKINDSEFVVENRTEVRSQIKGSYRLPALRSVGSYPANPFRLRDMTGNAEEWCWDAFRDFRRGYRVDFVDSLTTPFRALRGGSSMSGSIWGAGSNLYLDAGFRRGMSPASSFNLFSLRLVRKAK